MVFRPFLLSFKISMYFKVQNIHESFSLCDLNYESLKLISKIELFRRLNLLSPDKPLFLKLFQKTIIEINFDIFLDWVLSWIRTRIILHILEIVGI